MAPRCGSPPPRPARGSFHGLRHGGASWRVMGDLTGKPAAVAMVQRWMGDASIATTMGNAHLAPDVLRHVAVDVRDAIPSSITASFVGHDGVPRNDPSTEAATTGFLGTLEGTRTPDRRIRNPLLWPTELRGRWSGSGRRDSNPRQRAPKARALPGCATPRAMREPGLYHAAPPPSAKVYDFSTTDVTARLGWCRPPIPFRRLVAVAQPVEHRIVAPSVAGSNPVGHPRTSPAPVAQWIEHRTSDPTVGGSTPSGRAAEKLDRSPR